MHRIHQAVTYCTFTTQLFPPLATLNYIATPHIPILWSLVAYGGHRAVRHSTPASFNPVIHIQLTPAGTCQQPRVATTPLPW
jgi:hypothetical protein